MFRPSVMVSSKTFEGVFVHSFYNSTHFLPSCCCPFLLHVVANLICTWSDNKLREIIALLQCYIPHFWIPPWSPSKYSPWEAMHLCRRLVHPSKQFWNCVLCNGLQSCRCIIPDVINVINMPSFQYFLYFQEQKRSHWGLDPVNRQGVPTQFV